MQENPNKTDVDQQEKTEMLSLVSVMNSLVEQGFKTQFKAVEKGLKSLDTEKIFQPDEIKIVNFYRFEGESDPGDNSILYVIETNDGEKGTLTDSYGANSDTNVTKFTKQVEDIHKAVNK